METQYSWMLMPSCQLKLSKWKVVRLGLGLVQYVKQVPDTSQSTKNLVDMQWWHQHQLVTNQRVQAMS